MNRAILAMVVGLFVIPMAGCAASVDDPVPSPPVQEEQRPPPQEPFNTKLRDPTALLVGGMAVDHGLEDVDLVTKPPAPLPDPEGN